MSTTTVDQSTAVLLVDQIRSGVHTQRHIEQYLSTTAVDLEQGVYSSVYSLDDEDRAALLPGRSFVDLLNVPGEPTAATSGPIEDSHAVVYDEYGRVRSRRSTLAQHGTDDRARPDG